MVFQVCKNLGIDDPCAWMNAVSPLVIDQWIAFELNQLDEKNTTEMMTPEDALNRMTSNA